MPPSDAPFVILVADDDAEDCLLIKEAVAETGIPHVIRFVADGAELLEYLNRTGRYANGGAPRPSLILLDLNMPRKDGREVLGDLRGDDRFKTIPVVILTTSASEDDVSYCYRNGANSFVCKPATFRTWIETVRTLCSYWFQLCNLPSH
jgi:CheY-like chemotaxis protein